MESVPESVEELTRQWRRAGIDLAKLKRDEKGSITAVRRVRADPTALPVIAGEGSDIAIGEAIGEGGNAIVALAKQSSLDREVAVKKLREPAAAEAERALVHEGLVLGALEHPNIVPVHLLGRDQKGSPLIVLKRVEGVEWSEFIGGGEPLESPDESADPLAWNLGVLMQVASAVHFAHQRGVVHRDVKPENVMIGEHGEIYLMDWGSAVRIDGGPSHVPHAREVHDIEGTPEYMAPEMAAAKGEQIGTHTDVYLLGACLHEIIGGWPPHESKDLRSALYHAYTSEPPRFSDDVPEELAAICARALSRDPGARQPSAAELRAEIATFLRHRHSTALAHEASARAEALERTLAADEVERAGAYKLYGECWFGFENALREWPENPEAARGRTRVVGAMIRYEIARRSPEAARALLGDLGGDDPELVQRIVELERSAAAERRQQEKLTRLGRDHDTDIARPERRRLVFGLCAIYGAALVGFEFADSFGLGQPAWGSYLALLCGYGLVLFAAVLRWRGALTHNRANRRFVALMSLSVLVPLGTLGLAWGAGVPLGFAVAMISLLHGTLGISVAFLVHKRLAWSTLPFGGAFVAAALVPQHAFAFAGLAALGCGAVLAYQWRAGDRVRRVIEVEEGP